LFSSICSESKESNACNDDRQSGEYGKQPLHPPLGLNLYVIQGVASDVPLGHIFRGVLPFLAADLVHLLLLVLFPAIALALPAMMAP